MLFERIDSEIAPMRATYQSLIDNPARLEELLLKGAAKARAIATPFTTTLRHAVGLRDLRAAKTEKSGKQAKAALPVFKQYREADGKFYFKLVDAAGLLLLQSAGYATPKEAGQAIRDLQQGDAAKLPFPPAPGASIEAVTQALIQLRDA
jgi:tryptophanyl-tRNA synthetase